MGLHTMPDGDTLGACTAMKYLLERDFNCNCKIVSFDFLSSNLECLSFSSEVEFSKDLSDFNLNKFDVLLLMDSGVIEKFSAKLGKKFIIPKNVFVINIDHHDTNNFYGDLNYVNPKSPAICSILVDFFRYVGVNFDSELSKRLLLGVCTDSGFFSYKNGEKALKDAFFLINHNVNYIDDIVKPVLYNSPLKLKKYFGLLFHHLKFNEDLKVGYSSVGYEEIRDLNLNSSEVRLGINELQAIKEFDFVFSLVELENFIKGSFRSTKGVDVCLFAKELGGGGHKAAAAFNLNKMPLKKAEEIVFDIINRVGVVKE